MFELNRSLPDGALISRSRERLRAALSGTSATWLEGVKDCFETDQHDVAQGWRAGVEMAIPVRPNKGNGRFTDKNGLAGLQCFANVNCGLVVDHITSNASRFTMAVIYRDLQDDSPRTLLTLNTASFQERAKTYLFLSDDGARYTVKDTSGAVEVVVPKRPNLPASRMVIVTLSGDRLAVATELGAAHVMQGADPDMGVAADLFIGCRSHRKGLHKTLGSSVIQDVFFWPDHPLLLPRGEIDSEQYTALKRYYLWEH